MFVLSSSSCRALVLAVGSLLPLVVRAQSTADDPPPGRRSFTSPADGDTVGYWQQRVHYRIVATLDEAAQRLRSTGELTYVNNSPDTLRELFLHQHLNAFRPGSQWSRDDEREGRVRFQQLQEPDFAYERFTSAPLIDGVGVIPVYPNAPDSTVVRLALPRALRPGDSVRVGFAWDARPSTLPRRQGRRGRHWDFAQWYPKVAVYNRGGWQPNMLRPAGEFYGEFGSYDVTLVLRDDQVVGATGVPVSGDPGWARARRWGEVRVGSAAYGEPPPGPNVSVPDGHKAVRFLAKDIHHFAFTTSPDYRYEGGVYVRPSTAPSRFVTWDTVGIYTLYRSGDEQQWGNGVAVNRTITALRWLESVYGPYAYPLMGTAHRLEGGGTEFPMLQMNGSASLGLILHEGGHIYSYGILANNEWDAGWLDEGLTSYQSSWALNLTPQERARDRATDPPRLIPRGYREQAITMSQEEQQSVSQARLDMLGITEPIGTRAHEFSEFAIYNAMIYNRAELMYGQLRDVLGDTTFRSFLRDYYSRWALRHVDEQAMLASAQRTSGRSLGWFFDQWVHRTGLTDYAIHDTDIRQGPDGRWVTTATVERRGEYRHPIAVGAFANGAWTIARTDPQSDVQRVAITTGARPDSVRLDPLHTSNDWDRRNDVPGGVAWSRVNHVFDWPFLDQMDRNQTIAAWMPMGWYSEPYGAVLGVRSRSSYLGNVDRLEIGAVATSRAADSRFPEGMPLDGSPAYARVQAWARLENPYLPFLSRPLMGHRFGVALLDGVFKTDWTRTWDVSPFRVARGPRINASLGALGTFPYDANGLPEQWRDASLLELNGVVTGRTPAGTIAGDEWRGRVSFAAGYADGGALDTTVTSANAYAKIEAEAARTAFLLDSATTLTVRAFGGWTTNTPEQRALHASVRDPIESFENHLWRPRGAVLKQRGINYLPLGGAQLRGYSPFVTLESAVAANGEVSRRVYQVSRSVGTMSLWLSGFGDVGFASAGSGTLLDGALLADAGIGAVLRGRFYDREIRLRLDLPIWVHQPALAGGRGLSHRLGDLALRWVVSTGEW
jgi:hypothetical protein